MEAHLILKRKVVISIEKLIKELRKVFWDSRTSYGD